MNEKIFNFRLRREPKRVQEAYDSYLARERRESAERRGGRPRDISLEEREEILEKVRVVAEREDELKIDAFDMSRKWEGAHSEGGRPPIGGAQDD